LMSKSSCGLRGVKTRSKGEMLLWEQFPEWQYEPFTVEYTRPYIPDFVTPQGTLIEYKEYLTREEYQRIKYVARSMAMQHKLFIVVVKDVPVKKSTWPLKGQHMVAYLSKEGIRSLAFGPYCPDLAQAIKSEEDKFGKSTARAVDNS